MDPMRKDVRDFGLDELEEIFSAWGEPAYRARQMYSWLYKKNVSDFDGMSDFPERLIAELKKLYFVGSLECLGTDAAADRTLKFLWGLEDGHSVETVLIPQKKRRTVCLSTQVGCKFGCPFCISGSKGFVRNLTASEIVGQVLGVKSSRDVDITHLVLMGIGEPLDNFDQVARAIRIMNHPEGLQIGARRITLSTCGLVPGIQKLSRLGLQIGLSVSLHATTDALRDRLVPVNRKYPLRQLIEACQAYTQRTGRRITLEYALINGVNDSDDEAKRLGDAAKRLKAKVNLISCNPNQSPEYKGTNRERTRNFQDVVASRGADVTLRHTKGDRILAACGQLAIDRRGEQWG
jgi:23S rRNA (adenine2503-C2)-methyltransferase